jgi:hypothetical protein
MSCFTGLAGTAVPVLWNFMQIGYMARLRSHSKDIGSFRNRLFRHPSYFLDRRRPASRSPRSARISRRTRKGGKSTREFQRSRKSTFGALHLERRRTSAFITVANTASLNAEDNELIDSTETAVDLALLDNKINVGVLRGGEMSHPLYTGKRKFSAGVKLNAIDQHILVRGRATL